MRISSILRLASGALLLCSISSFSGCEKENVGPNGGCQKKTTTTPAPTTTTTTTTSGNS